MNTVKTYLVISITVALSACTAMENFDTHRMDIQVTSPQTASLKVVTNQPKVFVIPNSNCISLSDNVARLVDKMPTRTEKRSFWFGEYKWALKEFPVYSSLGMPKIDLTYLHQNFDVPLWSKTYAARELKVNAREPLVIFMQKVGDQLSPISVLFGASAETEYGFGLSFIPNANHDYEIVIQNNYEFSSIPNASGGSTSTNRYEYSYYLFDITNSKVVNLTPTTSRAVGCSKH